MFHLFNPKNKRVIAGVIAILLVASMVLAALVSIAGVM